MIDRIFAAAWLLLTIGYAAVAWTYEAQFSYEPIGPRAYPLLMAAFSGACALWLLLRPKSIAETLTGLPEGGLFRASVMIAGMFGYAFLFEWIGFPLSTALMTMVLGRFFGGTWLKLAVAGLGLGVFLYLLFDKLLDVTLPLGTLWG
jgi:putative tricarboxylic transport membrane protein